MNRIASSANDLSNFEEAKVHFHANQKALEKAMDNAEVEETMHDEQETNDNYFGFVDKSPLLAGRIFKGFQVVSIYVKDCFVLSNILLHGKLDGIGKYVLL